MAHSIKIHGGTRGTTSLCYSCRGSHVRRGTGFSQEVVYCQAVSYERPQRITYPIVECGDYKDKNLPSLHDMTKIATFINSDRKTDKIGFSSPEDDKKKNVERETPDSPFDY